MSTVQEDIQASIDVVLANTGLNPGPVHLYFGQADHDRHGEALREIGRVTTFPGSPPMYAVTFPSISEMWRRVREWEANTNP